jgi:hypothetical protein
MRKIPKILLIILMSAFILKAGADVYAFVNGETTEDTSTVTVLGPVSENEIVISQEILNQIQSNGPDEFERNVINFKNMLVSLNVHDQFREEVESLIMEGYPLPNILISYEYLYDNFGLISELEPMVSLKNPEMAWESIFMEYNSDHPPFIPRTFNTTDLEKLMNTPSLSSDDIMIADRVSFVTGKAFADVIGLKLVTANWKAITADLGVLYSADTLPTVQVTTEQINKYTGQDGMTEDQVVEAFVIAHKTGEEAQFVIDRFKAGNSKEAIFADSYIEKYE